jgi:hypothetical protein
MNSLQRIIAVGYALSVAYACLWIPFIYTEEGLQFVRLGYGWLWRGPKDRMALIADPDFGAIILRVGALTAIAAGLYLAAGFCKSTQTGTAPVPQVKGIAAMLLMVLIFGIMLSVQVSGVRTRLGAIHNQNSNVDSKLDQIQSIVDELQSQH